MAVRITHFAHGDHGWYLLFSGDAGEWARTKDTLKSLSKGPFKGAWYVGTYEWANRSKPGAWWVSPEVMVRVAYLFSNLTEMLHSYTHTEEPQPKASFDRGLKLPSTLREAYAVLNLPMTASKDEIKKAYRSLSFMYHPDHGGDVDKMKVLNIANELIQRRAK